MKAAAFCALAAAVAFLGQDPAKEQLRLGLNDADLAGTWIYDDVDAGFAEAKKSGKPMLIVFR